MTKNIYRRSKEIEDYCSICGEEYGSHIAEERRRHRCNPSTLRAIESANTRALMQDEEDFNYFPQPQYLERLIDGFKLLSDELNN